MKIKVLIVDDSAFMRVTLKKIIDFGDEIEVIATAYDGQDAIEKIKFYKPDVITLDIEMPRMNGIDCLKKIMKENPKPVIMLSSLTTKGAQVTLEAMNLGAVDFITKPSKEELKNIEQFRNKIHSIIKVANKVKLNKLYNLNREKIYMQQKKDEKKSVESARNNVKNGKYDICIVATSTGGPPALQKVISKLPADFPIPILIVQHMPPGFTKSLSDRLDSLSEISVKESENGDVLKPGLAILGKAGHQLGIDKKYTGDILIKHKVSEKAELFHPSANFMYNDVYQIYKKNILVVIMTGMGNDGLESIKLIKNELSNTVIAESEETAIVFGMPGVVVKAGLADYIEPIDKIADRIIKLVCK